MAADVRKTSRITISIALTIFVLNRLWTFVFSYGPVGVNLSWVVWGLYVLCAGALVYMAVVLVFKLLGAVFSVEFERSATEEALLFWGVILVTGLVVYYMNPSAMVRIDAFVFARGGEAVWYNLGEITRLRLIPEELGRYVTVTYAILGLTVAVRLIMATLEMGGEPGRMRKKITAPLVIMGIMLLLAFQSGEQFSLYRIWAAFLVLTIIGLILTVVRAAGLMIKFDDRHEEPDEPGGEIKVIKGNLPDYLTAAAIFVTSLVAIGVMAVAAVLYVVAYRAVLLDIHAIL